MTQLYDNQSDKQLWDEFNEWVHEGVVTVKFEKKDGTKRTMQCTLLQDYYPDYDFKGDDRVNDKVLPVWDVEKNAWRAVRYGSIISLTLH